MTVKELIAELKMFPEDHEVKITRMLVYGDNNWVVEDIRRIQGEYKTNIITLSVDVYKRQRAIICDPPRPSSSLGSKTKK